MIGYYGLSKENIKKLPSDSENVEENLYKLVCPLIIESRDSVPSQLLLLYDMLDIPVILFNNFNDYNKEEYEEIYENLKEIQDYLKMNESIEMLEEGKLGHLLRVGKDSYDLAKELKLSDNECHDIYMAAIFHDTGKYLIPDKIVGKQDKLDEREYRIMKKHTDYAYDILHGFLDDNVLDTILSHHERVNGSGYPNGVIPDIGARVLGIADSFDTMVSDRVYKKGRSVRDALSELDRCSKLEKEGGIGELYDREMVLKFTSMKMR